MRVIFSAGGTGGHLYPALALADYIMQQDSKNAVLFVGSLYRLEATKVKEYGYDFIGLDIKTPTGNIFNKVVGYAQVFLKVSQCKKIIKDFKPDVVIGFGGYTSYSMMKAAIDLKIPTMLHEQNSVAGKSNLMLASKVDYFITAYPNIEKQTKTNNVVQLGNPTAFHVSNMPVAHLKDYDLDANKKTVLIVMGSQGSMTVDKAMQSFLKSANDVDYQIIYVSGTEYYENHQAIDYGSNIKVLPYVDGLASLIKACDLIVSRAGASALTEILTAQKPSILVPSKYVTHNHQYINAQTIVEGNAAVLVEEDENLASNLKQEIDRVLHDQQLYNELKQNTIKFSQANSAKDIYELMLKESEDR